MSVKNEHLHVDISPWALQVIADVLEHAVPLLNGQPADIQYEVQNFMNECRARVQHAAIGMPDTALELHGETGEEDWLA